LQAPFLTVFLYIDEDPEYVDETVALIEEVLRQRIQGMKNKKGQWIAPAFPKLIYLLDENNIHEDSKYFYLTKLAAECISKRMMPDCLSAKVMRENYEGNIFPPMGCRSFLSPWKNENGDYQFYGRSNMGVLSLNITDIAL
jgi:ribonucleoside-triphosphate reductase